MFNTDAFPSEFTKEFLEKYDASLAYYGRDECLTGEITSKSHFHFDIDDHVVRSDGFAEGEKETDEQRESWKRVEKIFEIKSRRIAEEFNSWCDEDDAVQDSDDDDSDDDEEDGYWYISELDLKLHKVGTIATCLVVLAIIIAIVISMS